MRKEYDFSRAVKNPYAKRLLKQVRLRLEPSTVDYFRRLAAETGIPFQALINLFLRQCAAEERKPSVKWA
ncbi:MAG: antitoxin [Planctomycetes bacterium]|nr:antitoxin [Planctomycetota bacterium]